VVCLGLTWRQSNGAKRKEKVTMYNIAREENKGEQVAWDKGNAHNSRDLCIRATRSQLPDG
jgi:hypothetical protein